ncbi:hypothetical protein C9374_006194 [Naegleria lovaniensis]|uniref:Translation initiation factor IF2/IF5 domain-containing protein n=1 Tax=Naegleria lovaniensis TaxID=51637 RepID=A0AA88GPQ6_NAELO|nr:uncharacterized protein C9374_006194 [Naegleria lovaniensis]KAG2381810.1 hypothetical protein C9374_006194 [Naegleria lovaniensis]
MKTQQPKNIIQRPSIESIIKGRGNTSTTILTNLHDIANALQVPDEYILKYLQFDLCAVSKLRNHQAYICGMHHVDLWNKPLRNLFHNLWCVQSVLSQTNWNLLNKFLIIRHLWTSNMKECKNPS